MTNHPDLTDLSPTQAEALAQDDGGASLRSVLSATGTEFKALTQIAEIIDRHFPERRPLMGKERPRLPGSNGTGI